MPTPRRITTALRRALIGAAALGALATAAHAQSLPASLSPCGAGHMDPAIYSQALESWGWVPLPARARAAHADDLARTYAVLSTPDDLAVDERLEASRRLWADRVDQALVFDGQGQTLMLAADTDDAGHRDIRCFATLPQGALNGAFQTAEARAPGQLGNDAWQFFRTTYDDYEGPGRRLEITFVRANPESGVQSPDGFATRLVISAPVAVCPGGKLDDALAALRADGWRLADPETNAHVDALAWTLMVPYLETDSGGEDIATLLDLQRQSVPGLFRKADTDATRTRILTRTDGAMTLTQTTDTLGKTTRTCRVARDAPPPTDTTAFTAPGAPETLIEIVTVLPQEVTQ